MYPFSLNVIREANHWSALQEAEFNAVVGSLQTGWEEEQKRLLEQMEQERQRALGEHRKAAGSEAGEAQMEALQQQLAQLEQQIIAQTARGDAAEEGNAATQVELSTSKQKVHKRQSTEGDVLCVDQVIDQDTQLTELRLQLASVAADLEVLWAHDTPQDLLTADFMMCGYRVNRDESLINKPQSSRSQVARPLNQRSCPMHCNRLRCSVPEPKLLGNMLQCPIRNVLNWKLH